MPLDDHTYGLNKADTEAVIADISTQDEEYPEVRPRSLGIKIFKTPSGGITARSTDDVSSASCTEYKINSTDDLTTNTNTVDVYNPWPVDIPGSYYIVAVREILSSKWVALYPGIMDLRYSSPNLQTDDDGSWDTKHTATVCS